MEPVEALLSGELVVLPTDTVYGLAANAECEEACRDLYRLKGKPETSAVAVVAADVDGLLEHIPELRGRGEAIARALLPGSYTLVLRNAARRFPWLCGTSPESIGVRVPALAVNTGAIVAEVGAVAATSANLHGRGDRDPRRLEDVPEEIRRGCAALVDGGELPGTASTVIDFTGLRPVVIREGAAPSAEAIERALAASS